MIPGDERYRRFLRASAIGYAITGLALLRRKRIDAVWKKIDRSRKPPEDYWPALGVGYMATIAAVAWSASRDRRFAVENSVPLLVAKTVTTALFLTGYARTRRRSYALFALTDGSLLAAMGLALGRMRRAESRRQKRDDNVVELQTG